MSLPRAAAAARRRSCLAGMARRVSDQAAQLTKQLRREWLRIILVVIAAIVVHAPAMQGERIWDDTYLTRDNPFIKSPILILETFRHYLFLDSFSAHYRPVQNLSYMVDYFLWNTDTWGFHVTNVLLHAASGVLLYLLLRYLLLSLVFKRLAMAARARLGRRVRWVSLAAFCATMLWVVHPVHSAAVDYMSGRADSLAFVFSAGGWLLFLRAQRTSGRTLLYGLAAVSGLAALLSREIAFIWIALFVAHIIFVEKNSAFAPALAQSRAAA